MIKFKTESDVYSEFISFVADSVVKKSLVDLTTFLRILLSKSIDVNFKRLFGKYFLLIVPLFVVTMPKLSDILSISHYMCEKCSDDDARTYKNISEWITYNVEIFQTEIPFISFVIDKMKAHIQIDCVPYDVHKTKLFVYDESDDESDDNRRRIKLRQLYTIVLYFQTVDRRV